MMKKFALACAGLLCSMLFYQCYAKDYSNSDGISFYAPDSPGTISLKTYTGCSTQPVVCKMVGANINCSFDTSSGYICSANGVQGNVVFQKLDNSGSCNYTLSASRNNNGSYNLNVYSLSASGINCDPYPQPGPIYRVNY